MAGMALKCQEKPSVHLLTLRQRTNANSKFRILTTERDRLESGKTLMSNAQHHVYFLRQMTIQQPFEVNRIRTIASAETKGGASLMMKTAIGAVNWQ